MKQVRHPSRNRKLIHSLAVLFLLIMLAAIPLANQIINQAKETTGRGKSTSEPNIIVDPSSNAGSINPLIWGINAPGREIWDGDSPIVTQRLRQAKIHLIRIGAIQYSNYH